MLCRFRHGCGSASGAGPFAPWRQARRTARPAAAAAAPPQARAQAPRAAADHPKAAPDNALQAPATARGSKAHPRADLSPFLTSFLAFASPLVLILFFRLFSFSVSSLISLILHPPSFL